MVRDGLFTLALANVSYSSSALCTEQCGEMAVNERTPRFGEMLSAELVFSNCAWESEQRSEYDIRVYNSGQTSVVGVSLHGAAGSRLDSKNLRNCQWGWECAY